MEELLIDQPKKPTPFKTQESQKVYDKTKKLIIKNFEHPQTKHIFERFINANLDYKNLSTSVKTRAFLNREHKSTALPYSVIIVTENEELYRELKKSHQIVQLLTKYSKTEFISDYDIVQAIDCEKFTYTLEQHDNVLFYKEKIEIFPEQHIKRLVPYNECIRNLPIDSTEKDELIKLLDVITELENPKAIDTDKILGECNVRLEEKLDKTSISATQLLFAKSSLPPQVQDIVEDVITDSKIPTQCFKPGIPLEFHSENITSYKKQQLTEAILPMAKHMCAHAADFAQAQKNLDSLHQQTLVIDFILGLQEFVKSTGGKKVNINDELNIVDALNPHLKKAQPISYSITKDQPATLLTGANSGGKTTLIEHVLSIISLDHMGIPANGTNQIPKYENIYYFAKNKGSTNKGAFETMLLQLAQIQTNAKTLILADEMEAVTEPSIAAKVIANTLSYFTNKGAHCIFATHLGTILKDHIPSSVRIDGIHADGFDEKGNIKIDHNPKLNSLAASTPELIIQKLSNEHDIDFLKSLASAL